MWRMKEYGAGCGEGRNVQEGCGAEMYVEQGVENEGVWRRGVGEGMSGGEVWAKE